MIQWMSSYDIMDEHGYTERFRVGYAMAEESMAGGIINRWQQYEVLK